MSKVYAFLSDGFEEVELIAVVDVLRRASVDVITVSIEGTKSCKGSHNMTLLADALYEDVDLSDADLLFLPGGPGHTKLKDHEDLIEALKVHHSQGKRLAAICAAPSILGINHLLEGRNATCYPGYEKDLMGARYHPQGVITDLEVTTGKGMGVAVDFGLELVRLLVSQDKADEIRYSIQCN